MNDSLLHIWQLGVKELRSLWRDRLLLLFVIWAFSGALYTAARSAPDRLHRAPIAIVDEDHSPLSQRVISAFYPPTFKAPQLLRLDQVDPGMDAGLYTFVLDIPPDFQQDVLAGRQPALQLWALGRAPVGEPALSPPPPQRGRGPRDAASRPHRARWLQLWRAAALVGHAVWHR